MLDFAVDVRASERPSWLVNRLAALVVVGNPTNPASVAGESPPDVVVLRSLTKTWSLAGLRVGMGAGPTSIGLDVVDGCAPFVLFTVPDAELMPKHLDGKGIAVRHCDTFIGLDGEFLHAAVRTDWPVLR